MFEVSGDQLLQAMMQPVFVVDAVGTIRHVNAAAARETGYAMSELVGRAIASLLFDENTNNNSKLRNILPCERGIVLDAWLAAKSGRRAAVSVTATPLRHAEATAQATLLVAHDRTAVAELSSVLATAQQQLEDVRQQRLRNERLATAGRLAGGIGHELRNLAQLQVLALEALTHDVPALRAEDVPALADLERTSQQVAVHAERLLKLTQPAQDQVLRVSLGDAIREVVATLTGAGKLRGIKAEIELTDPELHVVVNKSRLEQVVFNLAINAVEAMGIGGGTLRISARDNGTGRAVVEIADTGPGVAPAAVPRIFEPFFTTKPPGASGLGLAVAKEIVEGHGGQLHLAGTSEAGAAFRFDVPRAP